MRYIWDMYHEYFRDAGWITRFFMKRLVPSLRLWDISSANLVDRFITNSHYSAKRIKRYYNRDAEVVYGPAAIEKFLPVERKPEDFYLFFGQLAGYKRADIAIEACIRKGRKLVIAGAGAGKKEIKKYRNTKLISFAGRISDAAASDLFSRARALLFPGIEDLGLVPIEANAAGCPVIAYRRGGVLDTVKENATGLFFDEQTPASLAGAMDAFEEREQDFSGRDQYAAQARRFSREAFKERILRIIEERRRV
jgi:glycosyltransferase involved in cell wall biosynthesis